MTMLYTKEVSQPDWSNGELLGCFVAFLLKKKSWLGRQASLEYGCYFLIKHRMIKRDFTLEGHRTACLIKLLYALRLIFISNSLYFVSKNFKQEFFSSVYILILSYLIDENIEWWKKIYLFLLKKNIFIFLKLCLFIHSYILAA